MHLRDRDDRTHFEGDRGEDWWDNEREESRMITTYS